MHVKAYVLLAKEQADTSLDARYEVMMVLSNDPSFSNEHGRFGWPVCESFAIGGRYTGLLYPKQMRDEFFRQVDQLASEEDKRWGYSNQFIQDNRTKLETIWQKLGGKYKSPLTRTPFKELGEEDDACLLSKELAEDLNPYLQVGDYVREPFAISNARRELVVICLDEHVLFALQRFEELVGKYWVVIIHYQT